MRNGSVSVSLVARSSRMARGTAIVAGGVSLLACGQGGGASSASDRGSSAARPRLELARAPIGVVDRAYSPGVGDYWTVGVRLRLTRSVGVRSSGNARMKVSVAGRPSEFVSRVGKKRVYCYLAAPVDVRPPDPAPRPGQTVPVKIEALGEKLETEAKLHSAAEARRLQERIGCGGRKER
jgi:hypothetical protein